MERGEGGKLTGDVEGGPEGREADGQLARGVEVGGHEDGAGDEAALEEADEGPGGVKGAAAGHEGLEGRCGLSARVVRVADHSPIVSLTGKSPAAHELYQCLVRWHIPMKNGRSVCVRVCGWKGKGCCLLLAVRA